MTTRVSAQRSFKPHFLRTFSTFSVVLFAAALVLIPAWFSVGANGFGHNEGSRQSPWQPTNDHVSLLTNSSLDLSKRRILANDHTISADIVAESAAVLTIQIVTPPTAGSASINARGGIAYTPFADTLGGVDRIEYRVLEDGVDRGTAKVVIYLSPPIQPISGRWQTKSCDAQVCPASSDFGHGAEIGFYHAEGKYFMACDWQDRALHNCERYVVDPNEGKAGWRPLVADFDGDGWDELAVHDPQTGRISIARPGSMSGLQNSDQFTANLEQPGYAVMGDWFSSHSELLGLFRPAEGDFLVETEGHYFQVVSFGDDSSRLEPLAGNWDSQGSDQLAIWDYDSRTLSYLQDDFTFLPDATWVPYDNQNGGTIPGIPFALQLNQSDPRAAVGFYDPSNDSLVITTVLEIHCRSHPNDPQCGTLPMQVPVDPGGGGSSGGGGGGGGGSGDDPWTFPVEDR